MCRLLCVRSDEDFLIKPHLEKFAAISKNSKEFQGDGWGCTYLKDGQWYTYKNIRSVWQDDLHAFGSAKMLVAHARSAFEGSDIRVENNMPFISGEIAFVFNGELRGVTISEVGRIGAEKIFNFILRFYKGDLRSAIERATEIIERKSRYVRAMNMILAHKSEIYVSSQFNEDPGYFTMYSNRSGSELIVCSEMYPGETDWQPIGTGQVTVF
jgi:predicted glutamine amidotransferase